MTYIVSIFLKFSIRYFCSIFFFLISYSSTFLSIYHICSQCDLFPLQISLISLFEMSQPFSRESPSFSQSQTNPGIVIPLVKISCSLTSEGNTTGVRWTHYLRNDLELVIQEMQGSSPANEKHLAMKVVAGAEYLVCDESLCARLSML